MTEFSYAQALEYYKESYNGFKQENEALYFEQDGASCHTSKKAKKLLETLFGDKLIQNAPHSPDIAYPIETLWAELKKRVKDRNPRNLDELRQISIDEWNKIPKDFIQRLFTNFIKRCKKIIELKGGRLEPAHLRQIRKETKEEANEVKEEEIINENKNNEKKSLKLKMVFNKEELTKKARKEIAFIRKKIKAKKKELRKAKKEYNKVKNYCKKKGKVCESLNSKKNFKRLKNIELENYKFRINWIKNYMKKNIGKYFNYFKRKCDEQEEARTYASTTDGEIEYLMKNKKEKEEFKKDQKFYTLEYQPKKKMLKNNTSIFG